MTKTEIIQNLDNLIFQLEFCAFCQNKTIEFRINKYRFCEKC